MASILAQTGLDRTSSSRPLSERDKFDWAAHERQRADWFNAAIGTLTGYDCPECRNRGCFADVGGNGALVHRRCSCMNIRAAQDAMRRSGLSDRVLTEAAFDRWQTPEQWQHGALELAQKYVEKAMAEPDFSGWFVMSGTPGSGKTRLCSTVFRSLLEGGKMGRYLSWRDFARKAKSTVNDHEKFQALVKPAKKTPLLYIDDFWKGGAPTAADIGLAFEILNERYVSGRLTILSSEFTVDAITRGDEAIGSRIYERSQEFYVDCSRAKNWRFHSAEGRGA